MELFLTRNKSSKNCTIGQLETDDEFICYTLEDQVRPSGEKVFGATAIPKGRYEVVVTFSNRFQKLMPLLLNVPGFAGVRIHTGNYPTDTEGCVLVGLGKGTDEHGQPMITDSRKAYAVVFPMIEHASKKGKVWLTIK